MMCHSTLVSGAVNLFPCSSSPISMVLMRGYVSVDKAPSVRVSPSVTCITLKLFTLAEGVMRRSTSGRSRGRRAGGMMLEMVCKEHQGSVMMKRRTLRSTNARLVTRREGGT